MLRRTYRRYLCGAADIRTGCDMHCIKTTLNITSKWCFARLVCFLDVNIQGSFHAVRTICIISSVWAMGINSRINRKREWWVYERGARLEHNTED